MLREGDIPVPGRYQEEREREKERLMKIMTLSKTVENLYTNLEKILLRYNKLVLNILKRHCLQMKSVDGKTVIELKQIARGREGLPK